MNLEALRARLVRFFQGLAGRLLALTVLVVLASALLVFLPAIASFHELRVRDRINLAQTAALALEGAPDLTPGLERELLENAEVLRIALRRDEVRELLLESAEEAPAAMPRTFDLRTASDFQRFNWAFETLFASDGRVLRVIAEPRFESGEFIEIVLNEAPLKRETWAYARQTAAAVLIISIVTGALIYFMLSWLFVRPVTALTHRIERFRDAPEDATIFTEPSRRSDEIGRADRAVADMAGHVRGSLRQRERLAGLGAAVARIAHDLRNALSTAQLIADRLSASDDPRVVQAAPRLERALNRAARLASESLKFGKAEEAAPVLTRLNLGEAANEAVADALAAYPSMARRVEIAADLFVTADAEHLHRILVNLIRNGAQAVERARRQGAPDAIALRAFRRGALVVIAAADRGAGLPEAARAHLFEPFRSADRAGGAGLGLAIARELARAQGGDVTLAKTDGEGAVFEISLPAA